MPLLVRARDAYRTWRRENGRLNFQDLLLEARDLLRSRPDVRRALRKRFTPILVDEFQDTDPIQAEIALFPDGGRLRREGLEEAEAVPGSLFVVGDPKQSIYRFRRADILTYQAVRDLVERSGGRVFQLSTNFRATKTSATGSTASSDSRTSSPRRRPSSKPPTCLSRRTGKRSEPARASAGGSRAGNRADPVVRVDAEQIGRHIAAAVRSGARAPEDFLILFRRRRFMGAYARVLEAHGTRSRSPAAALSTSPTSSAPCCRSSSPSPIRTIRRPSSRHCAVRCSA